MQSIKNRCQLLTIILSGVLLAACSSTPKISAPISSPATTTSSSIAAPFLNAPKTMPKAGSGRGGYYKDDGPDDNPPPNLALTLDAQPKVEPYAVGANKPYVVFGKTYTPLKNDKPFSQRGIGSWYGKKFHGKRTSSGELYDMYKMTAAHPTLPIPSYARITNINNGQQVIVKINDRGPFHSNRIVDLSYTAALKLDYLSKGSSELFLERLLPVDIEKMAENKKNNITENVASTTPFNVATTIPPTDTESFEALVTSGVVTPAALPAVITTPNNTRGFYLQLGAFGLRSNAEATFTRLQNQLHQLPAFEIVQEGTLYRLFSGPFSSHDTAMNAVQIVTSAGIPKPVIVQR